MTTDRYPKALSASVGEATVTWVAKGSGMIEPNMATMLAYIFTDALVDTATLGTLGLTSLVLTIAGYWIGRYGETTGRDRGHAPYTSVAVVTGLYLFGLVIVHFVLGENAPAGPVAPKR